MWGGGSEHEGLSCCLACGHTRLHFAFLALWQRLGEYWHSSSNLGLGTASHHNCIIMAHLKGGKGGCCIIHHLLLRCLMCLVLRFLDPRLLRRNKNRALVPQKTRWHSYDCERHSVWQSPSLTHQLHAALNLYWHVQPGPCACRRVRGLAAARPSVRRTIGFVRMRPGVRMMTAAHSCSIFWIGCTSGGQHQQRYQ